MRFQFDRWEIKIKNAPTLSLRAGIRSKFKKTDSEVKKKLQGRFFCLVKKDTDRFFVQFPDNWLKTMAGDQDIIGGNDNYQSTAAANNIWWHVQRVIVRKWRRKRRKKAILFPTKAT